MTDPDPHANPQVRRTHRLMLDAAAELLNEHGPEAVTHLRVAETAGVSRATVYRHWSQRADILLDLLRASAESHPSPPPRDLPIVDRVSALLGTFAATLNGNGGQILAAMIGLAEWDDDVFSALRQMAGQGPLALHSLLAEGTAGGSISPGVDVGLLSDGLIGAIYLRRLLYHDEITIDYVDRLTKDTLAPYLTDGPAAP